MSTAGPLQGAKLLAVLVGDGGDAALDILEGLGASVTRVIPSDLTGGRLEELTADAGVVLTDLPPAQASGLGLDEHPLIAVERAPDAHGPYQALPSGPMPDGFPGYGALVQGQFVALAVLAELARGIGLAEPTVAVTVDGAAATLAGLWTMPLDWSANGVAPAPLGNRDADAAPHGVYRCRDGRWIALACTSEAHWEGFRAALGRPDWCDLERMRRKSSRLREQKEIDRHIQAWLDDHTTAGLGLDPAEDDPERVSVRHSTAEIVAWFQGFGVPCATVDESPP